MSYPDRSNVSFNIYPNLPVWCIFSCFFFLNYSQIVFSYLNTDLSWLPPLYFSFDRFVVTFSSIVAVSRTRSRILNIRPCHVLILYRIFSKVWGEGCWIMWRIWVWLHWWTIPKRGWAWCKTMQNSVKGLNPGVISKVGWVWSSGWT